ncbi:hypothetical protein BOO69_01500 [Sulfitobacter alexandrii]|uniref:DUF1127 domain-containing protein n=1 Tax=Sulfitobacter alexandrii TaxID=1917485 RepID=A0A1J0WD39_9RHOB|nr:hypothetical protein [Sulfitobacter alexandrii]APE42233.1 hypothetical protein BOO69_01500 [Sulfitobacter alexandrii]
MTDYSISSQRRTARIRAFFRTVAAGLSPLAHRWRQRDHPHVGDLDVRLMRDAGLSHGGTARRETAPEIRETRHPML